MRMRAAVFGSSSCAVLYACWCGVHSERLWLFQNRARVLATVPGRKSGGNTENILEIDTDDALFLSFREVLGRCELYLMWICVRKYYNSNVHPFSAQDTDHSCEGENEGQLQLRQRLRLRKVLECIFLCFEFINMHYVAIFYFQSQSHCKPVFFNSTSMFVAHSIEFYSVQLLSSYQAHLWINFSYSITKLFH